MNTTFFFSFQNWGVEKGGGVGEGEKKLIYMYLYVFSEVINAKLKITRIPKFLLLALLPGVRCPCIGLPSN